MSSNNATGSGLSAEMKATLWAAADKLRGNMDAAEYKHVVLGLIFLKYISDAFNEVHAELLLEPDAEKYGIPEDRDEYDSRTIFWVPKEARWEHLQANAKRPEIGTLIDAGMDAIERDNPKLKGVLTKNYARADLDKRRLGELVDLIGKMALGGSEQRSADLLGYVFEYFLERFAAAEGKKGGQFYTPRPVVRLLVEMLEPYKGRVYDPCCGSGGMFVQSEAFIHEHSGRVSDLSIYGQESNPTTWRLARMNLAIRGIENNLGNRSADTFHNNLHRDLRADFIMANPPFNMSDWGGNLLSDDPRWQYGTPPTGNANFAWVQHMIYHLSANGRAGFLLSNGSMSSSTSGEGAIRQAIVEADLVDCMVALPPQLFVSTQIPVCMWFLNRRKPAERAGQTLFIDARGMGEMLDRTLRVLTDAEIARIAGTYHNWRTGEGDYADEAGFCKSAALEEIAGHGYVLTPGRYVGAAEVEDDGEPFEEKMTRLTETLWAQFAESARLEQAIRENLAGLGYE
jgi:type I restriction enzyme M protein